MGNVPLTSQIQSGGSLTEFQKNKLIFDFNTFFDLNHDGFLSYKVKSFLYVGSKIFHRFRIFSGQKTEFVKCPGGK